ncbi:hypothetical protein V2J09_009997 [Rumex salicifolius]
MLGRNKMLNLTLGCCKVYISESRSKSALETVERAAKLFPQVAITNKFEDDAYNRVGYTLVSKLGDTFALKGAVFSMVRAALEVIDFNKHCGSHPRLGIIDHICFHPLADASMDQVVGIARSLASEIGSSLSVPTFLYGSAHEQGRKLDAIRRELGYFKPNAQGNLWVGGPQTRTLALEPDEGPRLVDPSKGVIVIGATKWVDNYNVPVMTSDMAAARRVAKRVSGRGGGLESVQAMALSHEDGVIEVACNLLDPSSVGGQSVQSEVERLAKEEGLVAGKGYFTDFSQEKVIQAYLDSGC